MGSQEQSKVIISGKESWEFPMPRDAREIKLSKAAQREDV